MSSSSSVDRIRDAVRTAEAIEAIEGRELLVDPATTPDPAVAGLRERLQRNRQRATLRHQHRAARRRQRAEDHAAELAERGQRALRARQVATSPARRAANLARLQTLVVLVALPVIVALGAASTAGVHAFMTQYASASAAVAWAVEPAIITLVSGTVIVRALMRRNGATPPSAVAWIERGALAASVLMSWLGSGPGAIVAPIGAAVVAIVVEQVISGIADAQLGEASGEASLAEVQDDVEEPGPVRVRARWEELGAGRRVRVGGARVGSWLPAGGRVLLPIECAPRARARARMLAEGARAVDAIRSWERPAVRPDLLAEHPHEREQTMSTREHIRPGQGERPALHIVRAEAPVRVSVTEHIPEHEQLAIPAGGEQQHERAAQLAARARRRQGEETRASITEHIQQHPDDSAEQIADAVGVHPTTVRRHLREMAAQA